MEILCSTNLGKSSSAYVHNLIIVSRDLLPGRYAQGYYQVIPVFDLNPIADYKIQ